MSRRIRQPFFDLLGKRIGTIEIDPEAKTKSVTMRLPVSLIKDVKKRAARLQIPWSRLVRLFLEANFQGCKHDIER